ncbi:Corrinoid adenosyltransferase [Candidatus Magnetomoraceae bacterium gMMP-13]
MKKGLLMVNTGNGKGKTTASLGLAVRALGHGFKVCIIQFIKGNWKYGELKLAEHFDDLLEFHVMGKGFTWKSDNIEEDIEIAKKAWEFAKEKIFSNKYKLIILDELTYLISYEMVNENEVIEKLSNRPEGLNIVVTGRDACPALIDIADMVTEMKNIKHHYKEGIRAQKGIEF